MYAQLLIAASFVVASYQDVRERAVSDLVWIPAVAGIGYGFYFAYTNFTTAGFEFLILKLALIGGIAIAFTYFGGIGQADAIAMAAIAGDPNPLAPFAPLFFGAVVALVHIGYEFAVGNARGGHTIPMEQFLREQRWIPRAIVVEGVRTEVSSDVNVAREEVEAANKGEAMVEVKYGVPTVAYLGVGFVAYLLFQAVFNYASLASVG